MEQKKHSENMNALTFATPAFLVLCSDVITGSDQTLSLIKLIDQITALVLPLPLTHCVLVAELKRNESKSLEEYERAELTYKVQLTNPNDETVDLGVFPTPIIDKSKPFLVNRLVLNLAGIALKLEGIYIFRVLGKTKDSDYIEIMSRALPIKTFEGVAGFYKATFSTDDSKRTGDGKIFLLPDGTLQGADPGYQYSGTYKIAGGLVSASASAVRQDSSYESIFGDLSNFEVEVTGKIDQSIMQLTGILKNSSSPHQFKLILERQNPNVVPPTNDLKTKQKSSR